MGATYSLPAGTSSSDTFSSSLTGPQYVTSPSVIEEMTTTTFANNRLFDASSSRILDFLVSEEDQSAIFARTRVRFTEETVVVEIPSLTSSRIPNVPRINVTEVVLRIVLKSKFENSDGVILIGKDLANEMRRKISARITASFAMYPNMNNLTVAIGLEKGYYDSVASEMGLDFARFPFGWMEHDMKLIKIPKRIERLVVAILSPCAPRFDLMKIYLLDRIFSRPSKTNEMGIGPNNRPNEWGKYVNPILEKLRHDTKVFFKRFERRGIEFSFVSLHISVPDVYYPLPYVIHERENAERWNIEISSGRSLRPVALSLSFVRVDDEAYEESLRPGQKKNLHLLHGEFIAFRACTILRANEEYRKIVTESSAKYEIDCEWSETFFVVYIIAKEEGLKSAEFRSVVKDAASRTNEVVKDAIQRAVAAFNTLKECVVQIENDLKRYVEEMYEKNEYTEVTVVDGFRARLNIDQILMDKFHEIADDARDYLRKAFFPLAVTMKVRMHHHRLSHT